MRIKLWFAPPLPPLKCWYNVSRGICPSVHRLQEAIAREFNIDHPLTLEMDGFQLMPRSGLSGLVKSEDLLTVKAIVDEFESQSISKGKDEAAVASKKRKAPKIEANHRKSKTIKSSKKSSPANAKAEKAERTSKQNSEKKRVEKRSAAAHHIDSKAASAAQPTAPVNTAEPSKKSAPGEGLSKTKARNKRRKMLKQALASHGPKDPVIQPLPAADQKEPQSVPQHHPQQQTITHSDSVPSVSLLKRNRNKKRGFLDRAQEQPKEHVRFDTDATINKPNPSLTGGTAIITSIDLDPSSDPAERRERKTYPVQNAPRILTVNPMVMDGGVEDLDGNTCVDYASHDESFSTDLDTSAPQFVKNTTVVASESADMDEVIDYDACEVVNFTTNLPQELDVLAIKTLVLSATYTPEISDWREVVVKEVDIIDGTITVEHLGLTDRALREGGRFELGGDDDVEAERYDDDESIVSLLKSDIVDMRRIR